MAAVSDQVASPASGGWEKRSRHRTQRKREKRGLLPENTGHQLPPLTLPAPQVLALPAASKLGFRLCFQDAEPKARLLGLGCVGSLTDSPRRTRSFCFPAIFQGSPDPAVASLPSPATSTAAEIFRNATAGVVISSPTDPDAFPLGEEEGRWGREHEEEGEEKARPGERPCCRPESPRQRGGQAPGGGGKKSVPGRAART